jgi:CBS domain-containing protein
LYLAIAAVDLIMVRKSLGGIPILEYKTDKIIGIVTQRDIMLSRFRTSIAGMTVETLMTKNPITVSPNTSIKEILGLMIGHRIERVPVIDNGNFIGLVESESILNAIYQKISSQKQS